MTNYSYTGFWRSRVSRTVYYLYFLRVSRAGPILWSAYMTSRRTFMAFLGQARLPRTRRNAPTELINFATSINSHGLRTTEIRLPLLSGGMSHAL